jgi:general secretion pathway protein D
MTRCTAVLTAVLLVATVRHLAAQPAAADKVLAAPSDDDPLFQCKKPVREIVVSLKADTEVKELIVWAMSFTCRNFLLDPRIAATGRKVSIITPNKMSVAEAYQVFLAALATINLTVVPRGNVLRVVESATARQAPLSVMRNGTPANVDQVVRYVYKPRHLGAESLRQACQALKSDAGEVVVLGPLLLITDYAGHVREMLSFAKLVDVPGGSDGIYTLPVRHADAAKLMDKLNAILHPSGGGAAVPRAAAADPARADAPRSEPAAVPTKIVVDERTNTLIIASSDVAYQRVKALVDRLDVALEIEGGSSIHVYPLSSAIAEELAKTLSAAIGDGRAARPPGGPPPPGGAAQPPPSPAGPVPPLVGPELPGAGLGTALEGAVRVIADPPTNSLIVMSSAGDFLAIKDVIQQLDLPRREVYIEALILEIESGNDTALGTVSHGGQPTRDGGVVFGGVKTDDANSLGILESLTTTLGLFGGVVGREIPLLGKSIPSYAVLFQAVAQQTNANIISSPSIIAVDNVAAKYMVGTKIPVDKGTVLTPFGPGSAAQPTIEFRDFPLELDIKPHISKDDMVLLEVRHKAEQLTGETRLGPTSSTRSFETRVVVHDQETVVLGGLTQDREAVTVTKVPVLGDIPLLGYLFKTTERTRRKTNLLVMLTPYIIKSRRDLQAIRARKVRDHDEFARTISTLDRMKYEARTDYRKKRGLVEDINRAIEGVEHDVAERSAIVKPRAVEAGSIEVDAAPREVIGTD